MKNKRGVAVFTTVIFVVLGLLTLYLILHLPIPAFSSIKNMVNYFMVLIVWIALQVALVYGYFKLGVWISRGMGVYKNKIQVWTVKIKDFMLIHH